MKASTQLFLLSGLLLASVVFAKTAEIALRPQHFDAVCAFGRALLGNVVVQAGLVTAALVGIVSLCAAAWDRVDQRRARSDDAE